MARYERNSRIRRVIEQHEKDLSELRYKRRRRPLLRYEDFAHLNVEEFVNYLDNVRDLNMLRSVAAAMARKLQESCHPNLP